MKPRAEFVLASAALAFGLAVLVFVILAFRGSAAQLGDGLRESLKWAPSALLAALSGAWLSSGWHARALRRQRRWSAGGLTLRTLLLSFLLFPLALALWLGAAVAIDQITAPSPGTVRDSLAWLPLVVLLFSASAIVLGAVPAFAIEYFVCRRYLRRSAAVTTGSA